jgi:hypothetical protein
MESYKRRGPPSAGYSRSTKEKKRADFLLHIFVRILYFCKCHRRDNYVSTEVFIHTFHSMVLRRQWDRTVELEACLKRIAIRVPKTDRAWVAKAVNAVCRVVAPLPGNQYESAVIGRFRAAQEIVHDM